tara:strand:- start:6428 stop:6649 length:222 start_codon:yes stop_codon:yes gene_type:complete
MDQQKADPEKAELIEKVKKFLAQPHEIEKLTEIYKKLMKIDKDMKEEEEKEELSMEEEAKERLYMLYENRHNE